MPQLTFPENVMSCSPARVILGQAFTIVSPESQTDTEVRACDYLLTTRPPTNLFLSYGADNAVEINKDLICIKIQIIYEDNKARGRLEIITQV